MDKEGWRQEKVQGFRQTTLVPSPAGDADDADDDDDDDDDDKNNDDDDDDGDEEQQPHLHPQGEQDQLNAAITEDWAGWIGGSDQEMEVIFFDISFSPHCRRAPGPGAMDPSGTSLTGWMDRPLTMLPLTIVLSTLLRCKIIVCCLN